MPKKSAVPGSQLWLGEGASCKMNVSFKKRCETLEMMLSGTRGGTSLPLPDTFSLRRRRSYLHNCVFIGRGQTYGSLKVTHRRRPLSCSLISPLSPASLPPLFYILPATRWENQAAQRCLCDQRQTSVWGSKIEIIFPEGGGGKKESWGREGGRRWRDDVSRARSFCRGLWTGAERRWDFTGGVTARANVLRRFTVLAVTFALGGAKIEIMWLEKKDRTSVFCSTTTPLGLCVRAGKGSFMSYVFVSIWCHVDRSGTLTYTS